MKLAVALTRRAELQTRIRQLQNRLNNNALVQDGEQPSEDPQELMQELEADYAQLEELIADINRTNCWTDVHGDTLTGLLAKRECLKGRLEGLQNFRNAATVTPNRHTTSEIRILSTVDVRELQKKIDQLSKELRELDTTIQEWNWTTELLESGQKKK